MRGAPGSVITLTIARTGHSKPIDCKLTRETISVCPTPACASPCLPTAQAQPRAGAPIRRPWRRA